ncbi:hypothetical protein [Alloalcanivorax xenomutans]|jgi:hypothetical protein|uniref:Cytochrome oxidase Cu insertion factor, SCO1/SenC/PrrC family n=1 Tax=Alloalcanivorax xenomutans TaxID=1094342 RepID=A0A9Q3W5D3_9GAMM|nr:hypothetical protein [Alloalcanivorax xenomutans]ERS12964.1 hypothetical protein Q668_16905 [Alcanivorax sp. PN-3]KYZ84935.1 hypothetical protein A3Q32_07605 [Alcanivorax sp. KX64203]MBA4722249.1 hypothetical protein [Alcanivorax sp.]ARB44927.1 hypothetical protein P40_05365 [Alloalcanivorax xenomutans]MCE7508971.1 hypothetical protein [Alloalcanivorax xenomutans]
MSPRSKNRLTLLAILSPFVLFFLAGRYLIDPWELPRQNKGQLLIPHIPVSDLGLMESTEDPYRADDMSGRWTMMYVAGDGCDSRCKNGLYYQMRQVRLALTEDAQRVRRVVVLTRQPDADFRAFLDDNVAGMEEVQGDLETLKATLEAAYGESQSSPVGDIYLVSPDGQIFMRYPTHEDMEATLEEAENIRLDLKRTLKGSLIG